LGLVRIGIDEISYKRCHRYLTVVVDHDTDRLVWAAVGKDKATLARFFDELGDQRSRQIRSPSGSATPTTSSPSPYSTEATTAPPSPAANHPRIGEESPKMSHPACCL
jgi:Transposase